MPSRLIRDGILDSERYWNCSIEAQRLYWHIMLKADDLGLVQLAPLYLRRNCLTGSESDEKITCLISELVDNDLLRTYKSSNGALFGFIPRFGQRLQVNRSKLQLPPIELLHGDDDALKKYNKIKSNVENPTVDHRWPTVDHRDSPSELELEVELEPKPRCLNNVDITNTVVVLKPEDLNNQQLSIQTFVPENKKNDSDQVSIVSAETAPTQKRGTRLPENWKLPKAWGDWALQENPAHTVASVRKMAEDFRDYWISKPGATATKLNWEATWRNWVRKDNTRAPPSRYGPAQRAKDLAEYNREQGDLAAKRLFGENESGADDEKKRLPEFPGDD